MSSPPHQDARRSSSASPIYYEDGSESSVTRQLQQLWTSTATTGDQNDYSRLLDPVGSSLEVHHVEDTTSLPQPSSSYSLPGTSSQNPVVGTDTTYPNDHVPFQSFINMSFYPGAEPSYGLPQHQPDYPNYGPFQPHDAHQHSAQDVQTSQGHFAPFYPLASSQYLFPGHGGPVYWPDPSAAQLTPNGLLPNGVNTTGPNLGDGQHSHQSPVATSSSNQDPTPGPSRPPPSSPDRKRSLPSPVERRVVPRHDRAHSVHSTPSSSPRRSRSNSDAYGRGPVIPQERYSTSTVSTYNAGNHPIITFNLENPDQIGIPIIDILNKTDGYARIRDRTEGFDMGKKTFTLRVQWPGYGPWCKTIAAKDWTKSRAPVTRAKLAEAVATGIRDLVQRYRDESYDPDYAAWNLGQNGIQVDQICLIALHQVSRGSWQPELCLLRPRN